MAVTCLGAEGASLLSADATRATPGHCSTQKDLQPPLWSSARPQAHHHRVARGQDHVTSTHSARSCDPALRSAHKAGADNPEKALVPAEGNPKDGGHQGPHNSTLPCLSCRVTEPPRGQSWGVSAEHPATRTVITGPWQAAERAPRSASQGTHERTRAWECCREGAPPTPSHPSRQLQHPLRLAHSFIFLIKATTYFLTPFSQNQTDAQALQYPHCCLPYLPYFEHGRPWT